MRFMSTAAVAVFVLFSGTPSGADTFAGRVIAVTDGDTIAVLDAARTRHVVRLNGIDAPESGQAFGRVSKDHLAALVFDREVTIEWVKLDRYGRRIGTVTVDGTNANLAQLAAGLAWYYREYERDVDIDNRPRYAAAEADAKHARRGLWLDARPIAPWLYRQGARTLAATDGAVIGNRSSRVYHLPGCRDYDKIAERNRLYFDTEADAQKAGFRKAGNCP